MPVDPLEVADGDVRLVERVAGQAGGQEHGAPVDAEVRRGCAEGLIAPGRFVEVGQRDGQVTRAEGDQAAVVRRVGRLEILARLREQPLGGADGRVRAFGGSECEVGESEVTERARFPHRVSGAPKHGDGAAQIVQGLAVPAEHKERAAAAHQDSSGGDAADLADGRVEAGQARPGAPGVDQGRPERGKHICLPFR